MDLIKDFDIESFLKQLNNREKAKKELNTVFIKDVKITNVPSTSNDLGEIFLTASSINVISELLKKYPDKKELDFNM